MMRTHDRIACKPSRSPHQIRDFVTSVKFAKVRQVDGTHRMFVSSANSSESSSLLISTFKCCPFINIEPFLPQSSNEY
jgi:hypothetical protein